MLDEECRVIGGSDSNFLSKLIKNNTGNKYLSTVKARADWFVINHFAGSVCYKMTSGFVEKIATQCPATLLRFANSP